jgi:hypothetical protein
MFRASPAMLNMCYLTTMFLSHIQAKLLVTRKPFFFPFSTPPIKLEPELQIGGRLLIASNPVGPIKLSSQLETGSSQ